MTTIISLQYPILQHSLSALRLLLYSANLQRLEEPEEAMTNAGETLTQDDQFDAPPSYEQSIANPALDDSVNVGSRSTELLLAAQRYEKLTPFRRRTYRYQCRLRP